MRAAQDAEVVEMVGAALRYGLDVVDADAVPAVAALAAVEVLAASTTSRPYRSEEHTSELQSHSDLVCRLLLEKKTTNRSSALYLYSDAGRFHASSTGQLVKDIDVQRQPIDNSSAPDDDVLALHRGLSDYICIV